jgi:chloramphenicol-sensitive protein RarD
MTPDSKRSEALKGTFFALGAYLTWGFFPFYWKIFKEIPPLELVAQRTVWTMIFYFLIVVFQGRMQELHKVLTSRKALGIYLLSSLLIASNWLIYIYAINSNQIIQTSLGYYINPLLSFVLGVVFLKERLRMFQWVSVLLAAAGVAVMTFRFGQVPWIALAVAFSFGFYGVARKKAPADSLLGSNVETLFLFAPSLLYLFYLQVTGTSGFIGKPASTWWAITISGFATGTPLLFFSAAAKRLTLTTLGFCQFLAPTIQLFLAVYLYGEEFTQTHAMAFSLIWLAVLLFCSDAWAHHLKLKKVRLSLLCAFFLLLHPAQPWVAPSKLFQLILKNGA